MRSSISVTAEGPLLGPYSPSDALTHPLPSVDFLVQYWQRRAVHLTGWPERLAGAFSRDALRRILERQHETGISVRVSSDHEGDGGAAAAHIAVDATDVADYLREGTSVCIDGVEHADHHVASLAAAFHEGLGYVGPVTVKCYFSTPGYGFNMHFDAQIVVTLQIEGTKRWRVSRSPGVPFPLDNAFLDEAKQIRYMGRTPSSLQDWERGTPDPDDLVDVMLQPGDVLCLPAGTWHEAKAGDSASLALNFSFSPPDVLVLLAEHVRDELASDEAWRSGLPPGRNAAPALAARARELAAALNRLADDASGLEHALKNNRCATNPAPRVSPPPQRTPRHWRREPQWAAPGCSASWACPTPSVRRTGTERSSAAASSRLFRSSAGSKCPRRSKA